MSSEISTKKAAERLNVSTETIRRMIGDGELPGAHKKRPSKKNSAFVIPVSDIENFEARRRESDRKPNQE